MASQRAAITAHTIRTLTVLLAAFAVLATASGMLVTRALDDSLHKRLSALAVASAAQVRGEELAGLAPGMEDSPTFLSIRDRLQATRKRNPDIRYSYVMSVRGSTVSFLVDDTYGLEAGSARIGDVYTADPGNGFQKEIITALERPGFTKSAYSDDWGTFTSGYAPIYDEAGKPVAVLGVDVVSAHGTSWYPEVLLTTMLWIVAAGVASALVIVQTDWVTRFIRANRHA